MIMKFNRKKARNEGGNSRKPPGTHLVTSGVINTSEDGAVSGQVTLPSLGMLSITLQFTLMR